MFVIFRISSSASGYTFRGAGALLKKGEPKDILTDGKNFRLRRKDRGKPRGDEVALGRRAEALVLFLKIVIVPYKR